MSKRKSDCSPEEWERQKAMSRERNRRYLAKADAGLKARRAEASKRYIEKLATDPAYAEKAEARKRKAVERTAAWQRDNPEAVKAHARASRQRRPEIEVAKVQRRNAAKLNRTASWADKARIDRMYYVARRVTEVTGIQHHVDHVIPLRGELVSGLHVPENLMVVAYDFNCSKANRYEV